MGGQKKQKNESLKILELLNAQHIDDSSRSYLSEIIAQIKNNAVAWPVTKEDWRLIWQQAGLNFSPSQHNKILSKFPQHEQKIAEQARKRTLKLVP